MGLPAGLEESSRQSDAQLETNIRLLDPADRSNIRDYVKAITNVPGEEFGQEGGAASGSKGTTKRRRR